VKTDSFIEDLEPDRGVRMSSERERMLLQALTGPMVIEAVADEGGIVLVELPRRGLRFLAEERPCAAWPTQVRAGSLAPTAPRPYTVPGS
jgi:hypothetical protein